MDSNDRVALRVALVNAALKERQLATWFDGGQHQEANGVWNRQFPMRGRVYATLTFLQSDRVSTNFATSG